MATTNSVADGSNAALFASLSGSGSSTSNKSQISESQNRFLKLLTTQLKNQDPMNPLDNAQMTSQMAQISTVDGIERLNATLQKLISNSADSQAMQAAALVGHGVLVPGSGMDMAKGMAFGGVELGSAADQVTVTIKDANGIPVRTLQLGGMDAGSHSFQWDGKANSGADAADGAYTISVTAIRGADKVTASALSVGLVSSVERTAAGVVLNVGQQGSFAMSDVREIL
ncbi:flagellar hook assembly protein FlgD [Denitratisoma oestradiolicum]|uniref:Basal-body rod modification protein FlgD n=1 Tax=Denitratisoma oestradiolicum TaxID=311182 RepID=A0A6S6Y570_9PROT|nr:flagellar hook assembly protein FlgD [Denitratisoma oestradiolicum]TWO81602.1 flagellar biosynthesis protein FlgD [Denitratisoma oestradiolicum]CAB1370540.1 flagellar hook assembly protein [Denitratisoma oestradiolicum]